MTHCGTLGMGVTASARGRGIGRKLIDAGLAEADKLGIDRVELLVLGSNIVARTLYESAGFTLEGIKRRARRLDGTEDDQWMFARLR